MNKTSIGFAPFSSEMNRLEALFFPEKKETYMDQRNVFVSFIYLINYEKIVIK